MATIKAIESRTVHQIQSGQVIVDLCSVVKELVENGVDAGATSIDVRFKNQGLDLIEIQDNGTGISPANYESVCLKHHTSKLSTYDDLASLQTFGFRGEALASLCALSTLTITTCLASEVPKGTNLSFEASGRLLGTSVVAAQKGTTVSVEKLFHNLPVRRRELERNIKREWQKVIALLNQYACILTGLKFTVSQQPSKGKRIILFSTKGNVTTRENIVNIFSAKMTNQLVPLDLQLEMKPTVSNHAIHAMDNVAAKSPVSKEVRVVGHVSRPVHGEGRQTPDRQMFFVNGRPCGLPQFAKTFNEVYRAYNSTQSPFICADIRLDTDMYDVNVSPDKRSIMLHDQHQMLDTLRASLITLFDDHEYTVPVASMTRATPAKSGHVLSQKSTFRFTRQDTTPVPPSPAQSDLDSEAEDEDEDRDHEAHEESSEKRARNPINTFDFGRGSARRIPSANSLSRGGPHSQSLLHQWVATKTDENRGGPSKTRSNRRDHLGIDALEGESESDTALQHSGKEAQDDTSDEIVGGSDSDEAVNKPVLTLLRSQNTAVNTGAGAVAGAGIVIETDAQPIPSLSRSKPVSDDDTSPRVTRAPKRSAPQLATVTIGDKTSTRWIGSPNKRRRSETPESSEAEVPDPVRPSFGNRLPHMYDAKERIIANDRTNSLSQTDPKHVEGPDDDLISEADEAEDDTDSDGVEEAGRLPTSPAQHNASPVHDSEHDEGDASSELAEDGQPFDSQRDTAVDGVQPQVAAFEAVRRRKDTTTSLQQEVRINEVDLQKFVMLWEDRAFKTTPDSSSSNNVEDITDPDAESKLSLVITRGDFSRMRIAGQFNLGFIIAIRPTNSISDDLETQHDDELFIIDQHASDEKYNFERLQSETIVQSQRLVQPKCLELTALEEEIVMQNLPAIEANGFKVEIDTSGESPVGARCRLLALPLSRETTFNLADLEELISLLGDISNESSHVPRPAKVRKMFAMRACRSSVMIGKALTHSQMYGLVKHMGEMDKPWNCPHGRPTMRHLCRLQAWDQKGWKNDVGAVSRTSWADYMRDSI